MGEGGGGGEKMKKGTVPFSGMVPFFEEMGKEEKEPFIS